MALCSPHSPLDNSFKKMLISSLAAQGGCEQRQQCDNIAASEEDSLSQGCPEPAAGSEGEELHPRQHRCTSHPKAIGGVPAATECSRRATEHSSREEEAMWAQQFEVDEEGDRGH